MMRIEDLAGSLINNLFIAVTGYGLESRPKHGMINGDEVVVHGCVKGIEWTADEWVSVIVVDREGKYTFTLACHVGPSKE